jgi:hypothetical protein
MDAGVFSPAANPGRGRNHMSRTPRKYDAKRAYWLGLATAATVGRQNRLGRTAPRARRNGRGTDPISATEANPGRK